MPLSEFPSPLENATGNEPPELRVPPPGPMSRAASARLAEVECPAFGKRRRDRSQASGADVAPIVLASGRGSNLYDVDGNRYVDMVAGFGSLLVGHGVLSALRAMEAQGERLVQALGDVYSADSKAALLERLVSLHPGSKAKGILTQSGSDAVTAAIKTATLATGRPGIVAFEGAYHGLGYAPLAACGLRESYRAPFAAQLNAHVTFAPYPRSAGDLDRSLASVEDALKSGEVGAVLVEPILGRGGCVVPPAGFLKGIDEVARRRGALVIADEIWTGLGRSGSMVRSTSEGAAPDLICFGKGLGGGLPISACVGSDEVMQAWAREGEVVHTSTHAGWPLGCATAIATLDALRFKKLVVRSREVGARLLDLARGDLAGASGFVEARGAGLMIGIELASPALGIAVAQAMLREGYVVLTGGLAGETLTLTPALTIDEELLAPFTRALRGALDARAAA